MHNYYQQSGGEDKVVDQEMNLLKKNGIEVDLYSIHNDVIKEYGTFEKLKTGLETVWSYKEYKRFKNYLIKQKPDIVHSHNFFPLLSPSIYYACNKLNIPVVQTLHNYRLMCPAATFLKEDKICEKCLSASLFNSVKYGCYRGSKIQTVPVVSMIGINKMLGTWKNKVDRYIALTKFAKNKFVSSGIPEEKITVKGNFLQENSNEVLKLSRDSNNLIFVGRLSPEKGIQDLLEAWNLVSKKKNSKLLIIGEGPEKNRLEKLYDSENIVFLGKKNSDEVIRYMKEAKYLIVPSIWYEGFPMTIVEAYSVGTPVISSNIGSLKEVVINGETGFHFNYRNIDNFHQVLERALDYELHDQMKENVLSNYKEKYSEEINFKKIMLIYNEVIEEKKNGQISAV
ncbi:glycosyltransferase family 4 protein [Priestia megaterium]|uniref:glycosyltransferase family 4 protein n=1 Tax=Priestia megaterium TaxID=1404 RepID=UPI0027877940|nr:glycosyltransferase family 4 protein [Priestia megaterium]MDQ0803462.1 glycosyltransferase involved in cell wall biosynthesis [Priestia megaterium]